MGCAGSLHQALTFRSCEKLQSRVYDHVRRCRCTSKCTCKKVSDYSTHCFVVGQAPLMHARKEPQEVFGRWIFMFSPHLVSESMLQTVREQQWQLIQCVWSIHSFFLQAAFFMAHGVNHAWKVVHQRSLARNIKCQAPYRSRFIQMDLVKVNHLMCQNAESLCTKASSLEKPRALQQGY